MVLQEYLLAQILVKAQNQLQTELVLHLKVFKRNHLV
jgi:hypothetical protein